METEVTILDKVGKTVTLNKTLKMLRNQPCRILGKCIRRKGNNGCQRIAIFRVSVVFVQDTTLNQDTSNHLLFIVRHPDEVNTTRKQKPPHSHHNQVCNPARIHAGEPNSPWNTQNNEKSLHAEGFSAIKGPQGLKVVLVHTK